MHACKHSQSDTSLPYSLKLLPLENRPRLLALPPRHAVLAWIREAVHALGLHLDAIPRLGRGDVVTLFDSAGVEEVLVQVVDVLEDALLAADDDVVDGREVLGVLGQADAAAVRHNGDVVFGCHEQHGDDFVDAAQTAGVDLADVNGTRLEELLEHDAVLAHFARCDADAVGLEGFADGLVAEDWEVSVGGVSGEGRIQKGERKRTVVWAGGLLDEPRLELCELLHVLDCLGHAPHLVRIDHEDVALVEADNLPCDAQTVLVLRNIAADLELEVAVALAEGLLEQRLHLVLAVAEPASGCGVGRDGLGVEGLLQPLLLALLGLCEDLERLLGGEGVGDVAEVDQVDNLRGRHVGDDAPDGLSERLGPQVPDGIDDGTEREVDDALLRADPAQL